MTPLQLYRLARSSTGEHLHVWDYLERNHDPAALRHFHVALSFYPHALVAALQGEERAQRLVVAAEGAVACGVVLFGLTSVGVGLLLSTAVVAFMTLNPAMAQTFTDPSPHALFLTLLLALGFALARALSGDLRSHWYIAAIFAAMLTATLELSIVFFAVAIAIGATRLLLRSPIRLSGPKPLVLCFLLTLFIVWPGGWIRGGYIFSYGIFLFQALFRRDYFGSATLWEVVIRGASMSAAVLAIEACTVLLVIFLIVRRKITPQIEVFAWLFLGFAAQGLLNKFHNSTYVGHFAAISCVLFALCAQRWMESVGGPLPRIAMILAFIGVATTAMNWPGQNHRLITARSQTSRRTGEAIDLVRQHVPRGSVIVTNTDRAVWHYYLPEYRVEQAVDDDLNPRSAVTLQQYWVLADLSVLGPGWHAPTLPNSIFTAGGLAVYPHLAR